MDVTLNPFEMRFARKLGQARQERREKEGRKNAHGSRGGADDHILGVMGEMAFAKISNRYPSGLFLDMAEDDDVGGIQVRTRRRADGDLYLWKRDDPEACYVLMTGTGPHFKYVGFVHGKDAKTHAYWTEAVARGFPRISCFVVPRSALDSRLPE